MTTTHIKIKRVHSAAQLPTYAHGYDEDAGMDLHSVEDVVILPRETIAVATGIALELPPGFEAQIRPRSGIALRQSILVTNSPGTVDPGYHGEIKVILTNIGRRPFHVNMGDRIAQMIISRYEAVEWVETDLSDSQRSSDGFGSTGI